MSVEILLYGLKIIGLNCFQIIYFWVLGIMYVGLGELGDNFQINRNNNVRMYCSVDMYTAFDSVYRVLLYLFALSSFSFLHWLMMKLFSKMWLLFGPTTLSLYA